MDKSINRSNVFGRKTTTLPTNQLLEKGHLRYKAYQGSQLPVRLRMTQAASMLSLLVTRCTKTNSNHYLFLLKKGAQT